MSTFFSTKKRRAEQVLWSKLDEHLLPHAKDGVILAISGGPDSRALLESIALWPNRRCGRFLVVSLDHGVRHEAKKEAQFIFMRAKRLGFNAHFRSISCEKNSEKDLRHARYEALAQIARKNHCRIICTAHHQDDDTEGYFMALMGVGGGELGASMSESTPLREFTLVRPFLELTKKDLLLSLSFKGLTDFVRDRLDEESQGMRAQVRNIIFPELFKKAPGLKSRLASFGHSQNLQRKAINKISLDAVDWLDEKTATIRTDLDQSIIISAIWQILKKWSDGKDLRACKHTIDRLMDDLPGCPKTKASRLDPSSNAFNLKALSVKEYQFPGVVVFKGPKDMVAKRIDPA